MIKMFNQDNYYNDFNLIQQARQDLIGELDAIIQYDNHIQSTQNQVARQTWIDIRDEELVHVGELLAMITYLNPSQKQLIEKGVNEFNDRLKI